MYKVSITTTFYTKTEEQAGYIAKFFQDAESLMTCETSNSVVSDIEEIS